MYQVLMVCTGNICRSPMAEGLLRHRLPERLAGIVSVRSAGTYALHGNQAAQYGIKAMQSIGVDIGAHRARQLTRDIATRADLLLGMEPEHLKAVKRLLFWGGKVDARLLGSFAYPLESAVIEDPYGGSYEDYTVCLGKISPCVDALVQWLEAHFPAAT